MAAAAAAAAPAVAPAAHLSVKMFIANGKKFTSDSTEEKSAAAWLRDAKGLLTLDLGTRPAAAAVNNQGQNARIIYDTQCIRAYRVALEGTALKWYEAHVANQPNMLNNIDNFEPAFILRFANTQAQYIKKTSIRQTRSTRR